MYFFIDSAKYFLNHCSFTFVKRTVLMSMPQYMSWLKIKKSQKKLSALSSAEMFKNLYDKQCGPESDCSSSQNYVRAVCFCINLN